MAGRCRPTGDGPAGAAQAEHPHRIYYLQWHMSQPLAPMLFDDTDKEIAEALRASVVAQAQRSPAAVTKQTTG